MRDVDRSERGEGARPFYRLENIWYVNLVNIIVWLLCYAELPQDMFYFSLHMQKKISEINLPSSIWSTTYHFKRKPFGPASICEALIDKYAFVVRNASSFATYFNQEELQLQDKLIFHVWIRGGGHCDTNNVVGVVNDTPEAGPQWTVLNHL